MSVGGCEALVLVVDDDAFTRSMVARRLEQMGAKVVEATDGQRAFAQLLSHKFDLVILDLDMPGVSGIDLLGCIRGHADLNHLPAVVLTGLEGRDALESALMAGATSFLLKPLNWSAFGAHLKHLLSLSVRSVERHAVKAVV